MYPPIEEIQSYLRALQNRICTVLEHENNEQEDGQAKFREDRWEHPAGGGGFTRVLSDGAQIEKAGVNFSRIKGTQLPQAATEKRSLGQSAIQFEALGVSVVVHPRNPYVPTTHFNIRFILVEKPDQAPLWWFGGGFDLTPYYGFREDCQHWHQSAKRACEPFGEEVYPRFKQWCDEYFYLKNRQEPRGIGGIFFDDLSPAHEWGWDFKTCFAFMQAVGNNFIEAYQPILQRRKSTPYGEREREFQLYRRGRYVEFNLLYDRGTLFGLQSGGRTESILMSLPPEVRWVYDWKPEAGTKEAELYELFLVPQAWA